MEIYLVRHTTPDIAKGICYGQSNIPLAKGYQQELARTATLLPEHIDVCYTSPLLRCKALATELSDEIHVDKRLLELNFGTWELSAWDDIPADQLTPWMADYINTPPPKGETYQQLADRISTFWTELVATSADTVLIVSHAGAMRAILAQLLHLDLTDSFKLQLDYGSVTKIKADGDQTTLCYTNRT
ncbi:alpha-ribazole phosphatase [Reichenbachiella agariperforans]|uniref:Alpha-ribazole phosphatase n=1 Tax=Reichenbachiella agariperforans TaxID=156994 RepID=A0A1M6STV7_REIAG|nr:alpha-ribazole phosphatase [Reichenbachiella agariperforans]SHK48161.1 alpha-ribazole phosphatase [Reichenbachiella agariperforans]